MESCPSAPPALAPTHTIEYIACPDCTRLYPSKHGAGDGDTEESSAAPDLHTGSLLEGWGTWGGSFGTNMAYPTPAGDSVLAPGSPNWAAVNAPAQHVAVVAVIVRLGSAGLTAKIQAGGTVKGQLYAEARSGVGISEAAQNHFAAISMQVYRPSTATMVGTALDVTTVGTLRFEPGSQISRAWPETAFAGVPDATDSDYLWLVLGAQHLGPTGGGTGFGIDWLDSGESDLAEGDQTSESSSEQNTWIDICG